jgi:hypothetical protein
MGDPPKPPAKQRYEDLGWFVGSAPPGSREQEEAAQDWLDALPSDLAPEVEVPSAHRRQPPSFVAIGEGSRPDVSERVDEVVGKAIERRHDEPAP